MKIGVGLDIHDVTSFHIDQFPIINIENPLYPNYLSTDYESDIKEFLSKKYKGKVIVDGSYIDLNPGSNEEVIREITKSKVNESIMFGRHIHCEEIIFLSTFLPFIKVSFYDNDWLSNSIAFWKEITTTNKDVMISICNTFEEEPGILLELIKRVNSPNLRLAFDIGHALLYGKIPLDKWYGQVEPFINTIYLHSNLQNGDLHLSISEGCLLKNEGFNKIIPSIIKKNIIIKIFDKKKLIEDFKIVSQMR